MPEAATTDDLKKKREEDLEGRKTKLVEQIARIRTEFKPRTDIQTALNVLRRRDSSQIRIEAVATGPGRDDGYPPDLIETHLQAANFRKGQFAGAYLSKARLERASLREANFHKANLDEARLVWADMYRVRLEGASLGQVWLEGANLGEARLQGADLREAQVQGVNLVWADFRAANWAKVTGGGCPAQFADLRGGRNLPPSFLHALIGNAATLLPDHRPGLYIPHKWAKEPPGFDRLLDMLAGPGGDRRLVRAQLICGPGEVPMKTGTPRPLNAPPPWGARAAEESDDAYRRRVIAWTAAHPPTEPVD